MKKPEQYEGFLSPVDIGYNDEGGNVIEVEISEIHEPNTVKDSRNMNVDQMCISFKGAKKKWIPSCAVNKDGLLIHLGKNKADWVGKKIKLTVRFGDWFGDNDLPAVRMVWDLPMPKRNRKHYGRAKPNTGRIKGLGEMVK